MNNLLAYIFCCLPKNNSDEYKKLNEDTNFNDYFE